MAFYPSYAIIFSDLQLPKKNRLEFSMTKQNDKVIRLKIELSCH